MKFMSRVEKIPREFVRKVLLMDLDFTLFDYRKVRKKGAKYAIELMNLNIPIKKALRLYNLIVKHSSVFTVFGLPNFRHLWNDPKLYAILMAMCYMDEKSLSRLFAEIANIERKMKDLEVKTENKAVWNPGNTLLKSEIYEFFNIMQKIERDDFAHKIINKAVEGFEKMTNKIQLYSDAENFILEILNAGIEIYIITEGDPKIQMEKCRKLNLERLIDLNKIIVIDQKTSTSFLQVLKAIYYHPEDPNVYIKRPPMQEKLGSNRCFIKLAVIGDRYDRDLAPLIKLFDKNVITIRLVRGKYAYRYSLEYLKRMELPLPSLVTNDLSQAKTFLLNENTWNQVNPINICEERRD